MLVLLIPRRSPEIAALRQYVGRKAQRGDTIRKHIGSTSPEAARGRAATGRALPNAVRDLLDAQQRLDRDAGRLIELGAARGVRVLAGLRRMTQAHRSPSSQPGSGRSSKTKIGRSLVVGLVTIVVMVGMGEVPAVSGTSTFA